MNNFQKEQEKYKNQRFYFKCCVCCKQVVQENFKNKRSDIEEEKFYDLEGILFKTDLYCKNCNNFQVFENTLKEVPTDIISEKEINIKITQDEFDCIVDALKKLRQQTSWGSEFNEYNELIKKLYEYEYEQM